MERPMPRNLRYGLTAVLALSTALPALADVNIYSARHYDSDTELYDAFTEATGITVNRIEGESDELIARMQAEGANSPADIFLTVDAGRMWRADQAGLLAPVDSDVLDDRIPAFLRHPDGHWFGMSQRARVIFYDKERVENPPQTYEELADPAYAGQVCIRSSSNIYNLSLMSSIIDANGEEAAQEWAEGVLANMARDPQGGDTDQLRGIVSGECDIAVANTYYFLRALNSDVEGLTGSTDQIGWVWPNQNGRGTHTNVAAMALTANAPNPDDALAFMEFMTTQYAQSHFADQNNEYPAVPGVPLGEGVASMGFFIPDNTTGTAVYGENAAKATEIFNAVGWP
jgi:iron(III) transport system substrate-binding protein